ncbi:MULTISPECIES: amidohydrolase family protein [unclassified Beijerinckia]|uniref:amidohydrolase family protein n=1 Tax=unclassified Beijerinckia TaxID=2638183 RepID=UPI000896F084|nr:MULTISPECIES: amidohydrolase family protein [unclassified Beijerinckia]MDH7799026.1 aminocarboxymuconate-semialdehyde decarboxylase [Beijerinckia sp. GAS462]SED97505.1 aminocarboxymuconate-semialdehyde decarboxylase [Beijerinckia sp. 28-YEA-48]
MTETSSASGLHGCSSHLETRPRITRQRAGSGAVIDLHCHYLNGEVEALVASISRPKPPAMSAAAARSASYNAELMRTAYAPKLSDIDVRLADMDAMGVDIQALSPSPTQYYYWLDIEGSRAVVKAQNERIAALCAQHPDRLVGLGTVALQHPQLAAEQARHAIKTLGLRGFEISSHVEGVSVADERFAPFWQEAERLDAMVLLHPLGTTVGPRLDPYYLSNVVGQPAETAIALSDMIMGGHFDRYPKLRLCAVHGGGYLPLYLGRSDHAYRARPECACCARQPSDYIRQIWFDTVVYDPQHLRRLIDVVGIERVVVGTDYPFDMGDYDPIGLIEAVAGLSAADRAAILGNNARELLALPASGDNTKRKVS